jgi:hypothetical protein
VYTAPFGLSTGVQFYVRSGVPTTARGYFNSGYGNELFLTPRGSDPRLPIDYEANLSLAYNINIGPVTVTPQVYLFNVLNRQTVTGIDSRYNPFANYVTNENSPFFGQAGIEPGHTDPASGLSCPATASAPCTDNADYRKATTRVDPRLLRAALKITF